MSTREQFKKIIYDLTGSSFVSISEVMQAIASKDSSYEYMYDITGQCISQYNEDMSPHSDNLECSLTQICNWYLTDTDGVLRTDDEQTEDDLQALIYILTLEY
jgi:hypothetical protein